ncbi:acetyl-CoA hydrolase/transferase C-terminal domain-containing protein [Mycobacterium xenopi]|uniref:Acetyl-CoA hydrolase/transferase C-terminal domain-containing protein n=1 Tax=Mycobacterium xenopi TaxID=1789 RepID=A0AAD1GYA4_MYCXE|nr:acetyl-CoA hydrolase/transferase C-terminal domain-containing protein [Mycobacterium xenopi]MDA3639629.1 acetyl-CoA hydrolase [Mycobacterium xenopi]MDA3657879.1 acetyl-CoA hydrolase [Mycobacterium xenopi]MDA3663693.1 acetyl-CoA hydrolase [Mycobacterium xenopi]ORX21245.1 acetyl-CoA hydrolase [Mycobacterium xenopi]SPX79042.1 putative acetyl-CoA hydrolase/transferase [Mycobacterium xenopi]
MTTTSELSESLRTLLPAGGTIALGDGVGALRTLEDGQPVGAVLSDTARQIGTVRLVLGWLPAPQNGIDPDAFAEVIALMPGWGLRDLLRCPPARFVPTPLSAIPALLAGSLRPDVLITRLVERGGRLHFGTEVSWQRGLVESGVPVLAILDTTAPTASAEAPVNPDQVTLAGRTCDGPLRMPYKGPEPVYEALAEAVLRFVPAGARLQYGPGQLGTALLSRTTVPLRIDTGLLTDAVVDLDKRGLLAATPSASYLLGSQTLYDWADGKPILRGIEHTHDITRLSNGDPFVAVNTAIEIDPVGQINVEGIGDNVFGGIGGHPDYCAAASRSRGGLSIIAVPSSNEGRSPLVQALSRPASTPAYDVDLIVTESGCADLRGADWQQRRRLITELFSDWGQATDA